MFSSYVKLPEGNVAEWKCYDFWTFHQLSRGFMMLNGDVVLKNVATAMTSIDVICLNQVMTVSGGWENPTPILKDNHMFSFYVMFQYAVGLPKGTLLTRNALPTGRSSIVHCEWTLCTPLAGCGAWFSVFSSSFQVWREAGNLGPTHCYAAMLSGWQWHNALRCSLGSARDGPFARVVILGHVRTGQAWTKNPLQGGKASLILFT